MLVNTALTKYTKHAQHDKQADLQTLVFFDDLQKKNIKIWPLFTLYKCRLSEDDLYSANKRKVDFRRVFFN